MTLEQRVEALEKDISAIKERYTAEVYQSYRSNTQLQEFILDWASCLKSASPLLKHPSQP